MSVVECGNTEKEQRSQPWPDIDSIHDAELPLESDDQLFEEMNIEDSVQPSHNSESNSEKGDIKGNPNLLTLYNVPETNLSTTDDNGKNELKELQVHEEENASADLAWEDGVATLPGSNLKFRMNSTGYLEVISDDEDTASSERSPTDHGQNQNEYNEPSVLEIKRDAETPVNMKGEIAEDDVMRNDGDNIEYMTCINTEHSSAGAYNKELRTCSFCGHVGRASHFLGAYCGKKCIAQNARTHKRKLSIIPQPTKKKQVGKTGDLKIKIRLPSSSFGSHGFDESKTKLNNPETPRVKSQVEFSWSKYLEECVATGATEKFFRLVSGRDPYPLKPNNFKVGFLLEAIDPLNQSLFCAMSVVRVRGHRLRLQFLGYKDCYDIWVNSDSPFIFPCGFCERTGRKLAPPKVLDPETFSWNAYAERMPNFTIAPEEVFASMPHSLSNLTKFELNDKLEAIDRQNSELICVATIIDMLGEHVLVHFDGWESEYDYWSRTSSALIHPVGWCQENGRLLSPPQGFVGDYFTWDQHLNETGRRAAPAECFECIQHEFEVGMKLEAVDPRNQSLVRIATVSEIEKHRIKVHFDDWNTIYDEWYDVDSFDIHPINWCQKTDHPLEPPVVVKDRDLSKGGCPTPGCSGIGHVKSTKFQNNHRKHHSEFGCPYAPKNLNKAVMYDRLANRAPRRCARSTSHTTSNVARRDSINPVPKKRGRRRRPEANLYSSYSVDRKSSYEANVPTQSSSYHHQRRHRCRRHAHTRKSVDSLGSSEQAFLPGLNPFPNRELPVCWEKNVRRLPGVEGIKAQQVKTWSIEKVAEFINVLTGKTECGTFFTDHEIDGESLLLLTQEDILKILKIKLGPAVKIYNAILMFKTVDPNAFPVAW
ncbi:lethal(3)malignant brain tumor-like protein 4 [Ciona intestinalis]